MIEPQDHRENTRIPASHIGVMYGYPRRFIVKVDFATLRRALDLLLAYLEEVGEGSVELDWDFYWNVPSSEVYDPYKTPVDLDLGQLSDDWAELVRIVNGEMPPVGPALAWLAAVLRAVGDSARA